MSGRVDVLTCPPCGLLCKPSASCVIGNGATAVATRGGRRDGMAPFFDTACFVVSHVRELLMHRRA